MGAEQTLNDYYKKGVFLFSSSERLEELKRSTLVRLKRAFPWRNQAENSGPRSFADISVNGDVTFRTVVHRQTTHQPAALERLLGADIKADLLELATLLLDESYVSTFFDECQCSYRLALDFYPSRPPDATGGFHKDAYNHTTFVVLAYFNDKPVWGPEWLLDLGLPNFRDNLRNPALPTAGAFREIERAIQATRLPQAILDVIRIVRRQWADPGWFADKARSDKDHEAWLSYARSRIVPIYGNVTFFDPLITHSSPLPAAGTHDEANIYQIRLDYPGLGNDGFLAPFQRGGKDAPERKVVKKLALGDTDNPWHDSQAVTFGEPRAFLRIEVQAPP